MNTKLANKLGWIGNIAFIIGGILLANQIIYGWLFHIIGNLLYIFQGRILKISSLFTISIWLVMVDFYGLYKWWVN